MAKEKPPIFGMLQRGGEVVIRMLENVKRVTIRPLIVTVARETWRRSVTGGRSENGALMASLTAPDRDGGLIHPILVALP